MSAKAGKGRLVRVGGFSVFVDNRYAPDIQTALDRGYYEDRERELVRTFLRPGDKVIEIGAGIGVVAMSAASIVGESHVTTFDANPEILIDAEENFRRNGFNIATRAGLLRNRRQYAPNSFTNFYVDNAFWASRLDASARTPGIIRTIQAPVYCLEDEIASVSANVLLCDIEGGEVDLLSDADLSRVTLIIVETHSWIAGKAAIEAMARKIIAQGLAIDPSESAGHVSVFRR
jgi:FkbM family methyltransferase